MQGPWLLLLSMLLWHSSAFMGRQSSPAVASKHAHQQRDALLLRGGADAFDDDTEGSGDDWFENDTNTQPNASKSSKLKPAKSFKGKAKPLSKRSRAATASVAKPTDDSPDEWDEASETEVPQKPKRTKQQSKPKTTAIGQPRQIRKTSAGRALLDASSDNDLDDWADSDTADTVKQPKESVTPKKRSKSGAKRATAPKSSSKRTHSPAVTISSSDVADADELNIDWVDDTVVIQPTKLKKPKRKSGKQKPAVSTIIAPTTDSTSVESPDFDQSEKPTAAEQPVGSQTEEVQPVTKKPKLKRKKKTKQQLSEVITRDIFEELDDDEISDNAAQFHVTDEMFGDVDWDSQSDTLETHHSQTLSDVTTEPSLRDGIVQVIAGDTVQSDGGDMDSFYHIDADFPSPDTNSEIDSDTHTSESVIDILADMQPQTEDSSADTATDIGTVNAIPSDTPALKGRVNAVTGEALSHLAREGDATRTILKNKQLRKRGPPIPAVGETHFDLLVVVDGRRTHEGPNPSAGLWPGQPTQVRVQQCFEVGSFGGDGVLVGAPRRPIEDRRHHRQGELRQLG